MTTTALSNNLNELDLLLQDLSAARYSGHIERKETITESRTYSSHTQYQNVSDSIVPPQPPERTKSKNLGKFLDGAESHSGPGKFLDGSEPHNGLHAIERSRTEKTSTTLVSDNGNEESKWEYMGFGIWENRDGSISPGLRNSTERTNGLGYTDSAGYSNGYTDRSYGYREKSPGFSNGGAYPDSGAAYPDKTNGFSNGSSYTEKIIEKTMYQERRSSGLQDRNSGYDGQLDRSSGYQVETVGASNATQELDELMTSLNNFKMADRQVDEPVIPPNLDTMLGNLQEDMDKQGVKTTQKGVCGACKKPIVGQVITALGYTWHPEHFTCAHCNQELGTSNFFERDGKPFCEQDYHHLFSPRCGYCSGPILDKCISAVGNTWHPEHFLCEGCGRQLGDEGFHERGESAYCKTCYFDQFAPKCGGCNTPITEKYISSLNQQWHTNCFVCKECNSPFHDGAFFEHEGHPYCETHFLALRGSLCAGCHKGISGRCITAMFRKFHPEHFVCSFCLKQLNKGTFKEQGDKPYCHECFDRLFG